MENLTLTFKPTKFECPIHGKVDQVLSSNLGKGTEYFCLHCIIGLLKQRLQPIKLLNDEGETD